ncbi:hypothetical protein M8A51_01550 [Schlegelella sp. S2-27]|uniref:Uncharacterized protein n=1 Tax=Caldimonas mangrovi TaxID=2944811 RepID=A0ABT0YJX3_9BURK|nr:hypothetical protein [Caldimonas mangrovi]MCM5678213.1 hypothetical protein [Caldimonas mangrovi]
MSASSRPTHSGKTGTTRHSYSGLGSLKHILISFLSAVLLPVLMICLAFAIVDHVDSASHLLVKAGAYFALLGGVAKASAGEVGACFGKHRQKARNILRGVGAAGLVLSMLLVGLGALAGI